MYKIIVRLSGATAAVVAVAYITMVAASGADGPAGLEVSARAGAIAVSVAVLGALIAVAGWLIRTENRASAQRDVRPVVEQVVAAELKASGERIAAEVCLAVAGALDQRLHKVADQTAGRSHDNLVEVMREMAEDLRAQIQIGMARVHTQGMLDEAALSRAGGKVSPIRRDT